MTTSPALRLRRWSRRLRRASAGLRALPHFVIGGAQKAGTSSLFAWLARHPCVIPARVKEVHHFDKKSAAGAASYRAEFPLRGTLALVRSLRGAAITGEATPSYLAHPAVPARMHALLPAVRLIFLLRDPVARAYSHYRMSRRRGREPLAFEDALRAEPERLDGELARLAADPGYFSAALRDHGYVLRGRYAEQLEHYLHWFPRGQVLILPSERLFREPARAWDEVQTFLAIPRVPLRDALAQNVGGEDATVPVQARAWLAGRFAAPNERLFALLGERFDWEGCA